jgi:hypothetical protein
MENMKRAWQNFATQMDHYRASSPEISGQAIECHKELTIIMR